MNRPQPPRQGQGRRQPSHSNVDIAIIDPQGNLVHSFDGFPPGRGPGRNIAQATLTELQKSNRKLQLPVSRTARPVSLPGLAKGRGIRTIVTLHDERMRAYSAPVVETVPLEEEAWQSLTYSGQETTVDASELFPWLSQVYPPGIMERTDPVSKEAFRIERVTGQLTMIPAGRNDRYRFMRLSGRIRLKDEGQDDFSFDGNLSIVLAYAGNQDLPVGLQGIFEGQYPRHDRMQRRTRHIPLTAIFESIGSASPEADPSVRGGGL
ncbi:MAG: hypothetical protein MK108_11520 [Mariniblastus sp.]|nr:hypothetical protein [Mariniblastus sp.]